MKGQASSPKSAWRITVRGVVQGVGFRPFVYRLAHRHALTGWVLNHSGGVDIEVEGPEAALEAFLHDLTAEAPPIARIEDVAVTEVPLNGYRSFEIRHSRRQEGAYQLISPDIATCPDCLREVFDLHDRRYRYPFTNCTNCGPRFTIIEDIPYDRPRTTMRDFVMCPQCQAEYDDPLNRRFHAQPNACPVCGPHLELEPGLQKDLPPAADFQDEIARAAWLLRQGYILAIKGLGGFHLACDATNAEAVRRLRERKRRPHKPLAVMMATMDEIRRHCRVSPEEEELLRSPQCPIVLLPWKPESDVVSEVAPNNLYLGVMLPYTPLHHILLRDVGRPLVMTSGNLSEEPIAKDNDEARRRLGHLADYFLLHNRRIHARYDDSVWFVPRASTASYPQPIRRARGYAPFPIKLPFPMRQILACGAELKNTFCLTRDEYAFLSQHIGDLENLETLEHFESTIELYEHLFRLEPELVAYDRHPDYLSTRYALDLALPRVPVQHHHAHIAACLADNGWTPAEGLVIGVAFDGTGYGLDGHIWGGEWLVGDYRGFRRAAHLEYLPLPGGDAATRHPWRIAVAYLYTLLRQFPQPSQFPFLAGIDPAALDVLHQQLDCRFNCPLTSSAGRLFDAVSALLGVCVHTTYEAQAAIELEMEASGDRGQDIRDKVVRGAYPFELEKEEGIWRVRLGELFAALVRDIEAGVSVDEMGRRFHTTVARMIGEVCQRLRDETGLSTVALSGGCFQNRLLLGLTVPELEGRGFRVLVHRQVPCNDGGLALGQAVLAHFAG